MRIIIELDGDTNAPLKMENAADVTGKQNAASSGSSIDAGVAAYTQVQVSATNLAGETYSVDSEEGMSSISREGMSAGAAPQP